MNIQKLPLDTLVQILLQIDGTDLFLVMSTCKLFGSTIDYIIKNTMHDDIGEYLYRINRLPVAVLRRYLKKITTLNNHKLALVMLAAFQSENLDFVSEIIMYVVEKFSGLNEKTASDRIPNRIFLERRLFHRNKFFLDRFLWMTWP